MNVGDLFRRLSYGELANIHIGMDGAGDIQLDERDKVITAANTALKDLATRFADKCNYVKLRLSNTTKTYELSEGHAITAAGGVAGPEHYIIDTVAEPFTGGVLRIMDVRVLDDPSTQLDESGPVTLNTLGRSTDIRSIKTLSHNKLFVRHPKEGAELEIEYQPSPTWLHVPADPAQEIEVSPVLEEALELKTAAEIFGGMGGEAHVARARGLRQAYEQACARVEMEDLLYESFGGHSDLNDEGWV